MFAIPDDPLRFAVLVMMGTALIVSGICAGYKICEFFGINPTIGSCIGLVGGVASGVYWLTT